MTDQTTIVRRYVEAVTSMLLGNRTMKPGAMILAGECAGLEGRIAIAQHAKEARRDIVFLHFDEGADGYGLSNISIAVARSGICHGSTNCRLYLPKTGARAVIVPQPNARGHFRLSPGELLHIDRKPADVEDGVARATARLAKLVATGVQLGGRAVINTYPLAA